MITLFDINSIMATLDELGPRIYCKAVTSESVYIKFDKIPHSLRISDHQGRGKYRYRWNLRSDFILKEVNTDGYEMRFYPIEQIDKMLSDMKKCYKLETPC